MESLAWVNLVFWFLLHVELVLAWEFLLFVETVLVLEVPGVTTGVSLDETAGFLDFVRNGNRLLFFAIVDLLGLLDGILNGGSKATN